MNSTRAPRPVSVGDSKWVFHEPQEPLGLVGVGADLAPETLVNAYRNGVFPWPDDEVTQAGFGLPWFSPPQRAVLRKFHAARSLRRQLGSAPWEIRVDTQFSQVMRACAEGRKEGTWITADMQAAYRTLHDLGWAHSIEVVDTGATNGGTLVGGLYGVQAGGVITGESMFHRESGGSKVALLATLHLLLDAGGSFVDAQLPTPHLTSLGAETWSREDFLRVLQGERGKHVQLERRPFGVANLLSSPALA